MGAPFQYNILDAARVGMDVGEVGDLVIYKDYMILSNWYTNK